MRGDQAGGEPMYYYFTLESRVRPDHPLRPLKARVDEALAAMSGDFEKAYSRWGRPSIAPERLFKALLLQALYSLRSERQLVEQIDVNLLFRWFLDLPLDEPVWDATTFTKNRARFEAHGLIQRFFAEVVQQAVTAGLVSDEHFTVDGTLLQSWASLKSIRPLGETNRTVSAGADDEDRGNPSINFRGESRSNATHRSVTDPEARLARKGDGQPALLCHAGHVLMENRHGLCLGWMVTEANGYAERAAVVPLLREARTQFGVTPRTLGLDQAYGAGALLHTLEQDGVIAYVPMPPRVIRGSGPEAAARRRARQRMRRGAYRVAQRIRKRVEEILGWMKTVGGVRRVRHVGRWKIAQVTLLVAAAYDLTRLTRLPPAT